MLSACNMVNPTGLSRAEKLSKLTGLPIGKCLILLDCITEEELRAALEAQSLLRDGIFEAELITSSLDIVRRRKWPLADALLSMGCDAHITRRTRLGELLSDAQAISQFHLGFALKASEFSSIPLGKVLTSFNRFDLELIDQALRFQTEIRRGSIERSSAVEKLSALTRHTDSELDISAHFRVGELLCNADLIGKTVIEEASRAAARQNMLIGEYLIETRVVSESALLAALCLQNLLDANLISPANATVLLKNAGQSSVVAGSGEKIGLFDFLRAAGYLTVEKRKALMECMSQKLDHNVPEIKRQLDDPAQLAKYLLELFPKETTVINSGLVLHQLVQTDKMTSTQAILAFGSRRQISSQAR